MTLPKEIQQIIEDREIELTEKMPLTNDHQTGYYQGFSKGYTTGATEWAGRAQDLVDALEEIGNGSFPINKTELEEWLLKTKRNARNALAKYREVSNER
jgi:hypothetical protein